MCIRSLRPLEANEEIFVHYNYRVWQAPVWYQQQWIHHKRDTENVSEKNLLELTRRIKREYGVHIELPPPKGSSDRFRPCTVCKQHVSLTQNWISCETCDSLYHVKCAEISIENMEDDSEEYLGWWTCQNCSGIR